MTELEKAEMVRLEAENAQLRRDLDAGFAESDHLSAKYYQRMRAAEKEMHSRELHHFEVEQALEKAEATIAEALRLDDRNQPRNLINHVLATYQNGADQP